MYANKNSSLVLAMLGFTTLLHCQGLINTSGTQFITSGNVKLVIRNGGFINHGVFSPGSGEVIFTGTGSTASSFISGTSATGFYNLTLNKTSNGIQLGRNISVSNQITFTSGDSLFLNGFNIDLGSTGSLAGETNSRRITGRTGGYIQSTQVLNAPSGVNPGNLGFKITSAANLGSTVVRRGHIQQVGASIYRYYDITPSVNTGLNASVDFYYFHAELAGLAEPNLGMFASSNGGTQWTNLGEDGLDQGADFLTVNGINVLNRLTLANISAPLSVQLIRFYALPLDREVRLNWVTSAETNNRFFAIERSADGIHFMEIGQVTGFGNSNQEQRYQYTDVQPLSAMSWYRLRQVDIDGKFTFTPVVLINRTGSVISNARIFPNPVTGTSVFLNLTDQITGEQQLMLYNQSGVLVKQFTISRVSGSQLISLETGQLPAGIYTFRQPGNDSFRLQFVKQ